MLPKRILIIGDPASGKNFLADKLSKRLTIKTYDLDDIFWKRKYDIRWPERVLKRKLKALVSKPSWIICGVPFWWIDAALTRSQLIIILRESLSVEISRIILRFIKRKLSKKRVPKETIRALLGLIEYDYKQFHKKGGEKLRAIRRIKKKYKSKVVELSSKEEVKKFIEKSF